MQAQASHLGCLHTRPEEGLLTREQLALVRVFGGDRREQPRTYLSAGGLFCVRNYPLPDWSSWWRRSYFISASILKNTLVFVYPFMHWSPLLIPSIEKAPTCNPWVGSSVSIYVNAAADSHPRACYALQYYLWFHRASPAFDFSFFKNQDLINHSMPSENFLTWFIGLTEGDGSFIITRREDWQFVITQK